MLEFLFFLFIFFLHSKILDFMQHLLCWYICPFLWKYAVSFSVELESLMWQKREMMCQTHPFMWALGEPGLAKKVDNRYQDTVICLGFCQSS